MLLPGQYGDDNTSRRSINLSNEDHYQFKVILLGHTGVGKTSIMKRFMKNDFAMKQMSTVGVGCESKVITIGQHIIKLTLWDTAGQERFRSLTLNYYRGCDGVIIAYDITSQKSFAQVQVWNEDIKTFQYIKLNSYLETVIEITFKDCYQPIKLILKDYGKQQQNRERNYHRYFIQYKLQVLQKRENFIFQEVSAQDGTKIQTSIMMLIQAILDDKLNITMPSKIMHRKRSDGQLEKNLLEMKSKDEKIEFINFSKSYSQQNSSNTSQINIKEDKPVLQRQNSQQLSNNVSQILTPQQTDSVYAFNHQNLIVKILVPEEQSKEDNLVFKTLEEQKKQENFFLETLKPQQQQKEENLVVKALGPEQQKKEDQITCVNSLNEEVNNEANKKEDLTHNSLEKSVNLEDQTQRLQINRQSIQQKEVNQQDKQINFSAQQQRPSRKSIQLVHPKISQQNHNKYYKDPNGRRKSITSCIC